MRCPKCDGPVEVRQGPCAVISRREDTGRSNEHGDLIDYVPVTTAEIRECVNLEKRCEWARAGLIVGTGWLQDDDLIPLSVIFAKYLEYRENHEHRRRPRPEPGE